MRAEKLSKAGRRRLNKQVRELQKSFEHHPQEFRRAWQRLVQGWLHEVHRRAKNWAAGDDFRDTETRDGIIERGRTHVFGVVEIADEFLAACGPEIRTAVGDGVRQTLEAECVTAIAGVVDNRLNYLIDHKNYGRRGN